MTWFVLYCAGTAITTCTIFGANAWAREMGRADPFDWNTDKLDDDVPKYVAAMLAWPVAWLVYGSSTIVRLAARRQKRLRAATEERQRLLDAPLEY